MSLIRKLRDSAQNAQESVGLEEVFYSKQHTNEFSFHLAIQTFEELERSATNQQELYGFLLEDAIFISLYATYYEQLLLALAQNPGKRVELIQEFCRTHQEREHEINIQTEAHVNFVRNLGLCPGCAHCDHHTDVAELIDKWQRGDFDFFLTLYIGMQTIQYVMEDLIDHFEKSSAKLELINPDELLRLRQIIFHFVESKLNID